VERTQPELLLEQVYEKLCVIEDAFSSVERSASVLQWREAFDADHDTIWLENLISGPPVVSLKASHTVLIERCSLLVELGYKQADASRDKAQRIGFTGLMVELEQAVEKFDACLTSLRPVTLLVDRHLYLADHGYSKELERLRELYLACVDSQTDELFEAYLSVAARHLAHVESHPILSAMVNIQDLRSAVDELEVHMLVSPITEEKP